MKVAEHSHQFLSVLVQNLAEYWKSLEPILNVELRELTGHNEWRLNFYSLEEWDAKLELGLNFLQKLEEYCCSSSIKISPNFKTRKFSPAKKNSISKTTPSQRILQKIGIKHDAKKYHKQHEYKTIKRVWEAISTTNAARKGSKNTN